MLYSEKPAGLTLAEALGLQIPEAAPGGATISPRGGGQRSTRGRQAACTAEYEGTVE